MATAAPTTQSLLLLLRVSFYLDDSYGFFFLLSSRRPHLNQKKLRRAILPADIYRLPAAAIFSSSSPRHCPNSKKIKCANEFFSLVGGNKSKIHWFHTTTTTVGRLSRMFVIRDDSTSKRLKWALLVHSGPQSRWKWQLCTCKLSKFHDSTPQKSRFFFLIFFSSSEKIPELPRDTHTHP